MKFIETIRALIGQYNDNIKLITDESTSQIFNTAFKNPTWQITPTNTLHMRKGCFYIIKYNYNGNKYGLPS